MKRFLINAAFLALVLTPTLYFVPRLARVMDAPELASGCRLPAERMPAVGGQSVAVAQALYCDKQKRNH